MKVLWLHNFDPNVGGAGVFMHEFAAKMREFDSDCHIEMHYLGNLKNPIEVLRQIYHLRRLAESYDLVHAQYGSMCGAITAFLPGPKILTLRGSDVHFFRAGFFDSLHSLVSVTLTKLSFSRFKKVIVMSNRMKDLVAAHVPASGLEVLPDPIDTKKFLPSRATVLEEPFSIRVLFTTLDKENPIKRTNLALAVVEQLNKDGHHAELIVASGLHHDAMPAFVAAADVLLITSLHEGWPNSAKEAFACNIPVVSTDVSDLQLISRQSRWCQVCDADAKALAAGIVSTVSSARLSSEAVDVRQFAVRLNYDTGCSRLLDLYSDSVEV
jgi:glycosyltransferase involved in cell wall biosynthesis